MPLTGVTDSFTSLQLPLLFPTQPPVVLAAFQDTLTYTPFSTCLIGCFIESKQHCVFEQLSNAALPSVIASASLILMLL